MPALAHLRGSGIWCGTDVPLYQHTTFRIGGPARMFIMPATPEELQEVLRTLDEPPYILGSGANVLVRDEGVGVVISLKLMNHLSVDGERVEVGAGYSFPKLVSYTVENGLAGLETLVGIPASVGGAIAMNAGGRFGEIFDAIEAVDVLDGEPVRVPRSDIPFSYRNGGLNGKIVLGGVFRLKHADPESLRRRMREVADLKHATQPLRMPSAGCVFKNPRPLSAGKLIEDCGLKGRRVGGAMVSPVHGNFIVNTGGATAAEVLKLIDIVRDEVFRAFRVELELEIKIW